MPVLAPDRRAATRLLEVGGAFGSTQHELVTLAARFEASNEWIRIGKALAGLPTTTAALADGMLSFSKVRALTRIATAENERELVELAATVPAGRLGHALAAWSQRHQDSHHRTPVTSEREP